jgi:RNA polymerase sigma factor (sigma-70 family)
MGRFGQSFANFVPVLAVAGNILVRMADDGELLAQYISGSQQAFADLVARHVGWVYGAARRQVKDEHLAEDVTQAVFILLAQKARKIRGPAIGSWLLETTRFVSKHALRAGRRRARYEQATPAKDLAVEDPLEQTARREIADLVDESVRELAVADQRAILLRFYQAKSLQEVGREMGLSEDSARKRVKRAVKRLRKVIQTAGLAMPPVALTQWLEQNVVRAVPGNLTASSSAAALAGAQGTANAFNFARGVNRMFMWSKVRLAAAILIVVVLPGVFCLHAMEKWADGEGVQSSAPAAPAPDVAEVNYIMAHNLILESSPDGKRMWGFSITTGAQWVPITAPAGTTFNNRMVSDDVGVAQAGNRVYGFAAGTGTWDSFEAPQGADVKTEVGNGYAMAHYGTHMWAFSTAAGKWRDVDVQAGGQ